MTAAPRRAFRADEELFDELVSALEDMYALTANPWCHIPDGYYRVITTAAAVLEKATGERP